MGILDILLNRTTGIDSSPQKHNQMLDIIMALINNPKIGGLAGLLKIFQDKGLGDIFSTWVSTGDNKTISPGQVQQTLGNDQLQEIAAKLGISPKQASRALSQLLPEVVNKMTPDGNIQQDQTLDKGLDLIKDLFKLV